MQNINPNNNAVPPIIADGGKNYALLPVALTIYDEKAKTVYRINIFFSDAAPEMGAVLDTITLEKTDRSA